MRTISPFRCVFPRLGSLALLAFLLCACASALTPPTQTAAPTFPPILATPTPVPTFRHVLVTATPSLTPAIIPATLTPAPTQPGSGLIIEEHELYYNPGFDPFTFVPRTDTQASILAKYASVKQSSFEPNLRRQGRVFYAYSLVGDSRILARQIESGGRNVPGGTIPNLNIQVLQDGQVIFESSAGQVSPIDSARGLWVDEAHWYLEIAHVTNTIDGNVVQSQAVGQVFQDGTLLNEQFGFGEMFGFQLLGGKPFYFYEQDGRIFAAYDGQDLPLVYDHIPHYNCCSASALNPSSGPNWVGFFGQQGKIWYYTEILAP